MEANDLAIVWRALADPSRRKILDLLKEGALTTGEICENFETSRYAVMKHLNILVKARLVLVRREGRQRWNYLNAIPIQQIYERWVSEYESHWAGSLLKLKKLTQEGDSIKMSETMKLNAIQIEQEVVIEAPAGKVFKSLTEDVAAWWGAPYLISEQARDIILEPVLGGRFYEVWGADEGALWATVTGIRHAEYLELTGPIGMGGVVHAVVRLTLEQHGEATTLRLSHRAIGEVDKDTQQGYDAGWKELIGERLKEYVEKGKRSGLQS